jgi:hypothetical protein
MVIPWRNRKNCQGLNGWQGCGGKTVAARLWRQDCGGKTVVTTGTSIFGAAKFSITTLSIATLSMKTFSMRKLSIITLSIMMINSYATCHCAECLLC